LSTRKNLIILIINKLRFFSILICTIIVRLTYFSFISIRILVKK